MKPIFATFAMLLFACSMLNAQAISMRSTSEGFSLAAHLNGTSWTLNDLDVDAESGGGFGVGAAYGITPLISIYLGADAASISPEGGDGNYTLGHGDLGVQFNFGSTTRPLRPYLDAAFSVRRAEWESIDGTLEISGGGITLGGGVKYHFSVPFALDVGLKATFGELNDVTVNNVTLSDQLAVDASAIRINLGLVWYPGQ